MPFLSWRRLSKVTANVIFVDVSQNLQFNGIIKNITNANRVKVTRDHSSDF